MGQPSDLLIAIDMQNRVLVSYNGTPGTLPALFQDNTVSLKVICLNPGATKLPTGSSTAVPYTVQNMASFGLRVAVGDSPEGVTGPTPIALQTAMIWDATNQWFAGDLALNTTGVDNFLGTAAAKTAYFELNLTILGTRITILQTTFLIKAVLDELSVTVPTPTEQYRTAAESDARYMPRVGAAGDVLTLTSPNGLIKVELGINNDGTFSTNIIS